jgi:hypothetical protein
MRFKPLMKTLLSVLVLLIILPAALSLVFSHGLLFSYSRRNVFCRECGAVEHQRKIQLLGLKSERTFFEETLLKRRALAGIIHSKEHRAHALLDGFSCSFSFADGYKSSGIGNYWSPDKQDYWSIGAPTPTAQIWKNESPAGFCLHEDPAFVEAFERLVKCDPAWSRHQLGAIVNALERKTFPGTLVQFKTNRNVEPIFDHLEKIDLYAANGGRYWGRDEGKYPRGGTNDPVPFRPLLSPLRTR